MRHALLQRLRSCGEVRFQLTAAPLFIHCCHCRICQKATGSAFVINALIETFRMKMVRGTPQGTKMVGEGGGAHITYRCKHCKVALWTYYGSGKRVAFVRVSTLERSHALRPDVHIFTGSKMPWVVIPDGDRAFPVYYDREVEWPKASLARLGKVSRA